MSGVNTIIFGATGGVGAFAAYAAKERGANLFLAVRDLTKALPNVTLEQEKQDGLIRVQADLTKPNTLIAALTATKATRAFVYFTYGAPEHMKFSFEALKSAGVEFVVFLSTGGIRGDPRIPTPDEPIFWAHGQAEIHLEETFGKKGYVAIRPAFFASNTLWWKEMIKAGDVRLPYPQATNDALAPKDIGQVAGALLVQGPSVLDSFDGEYNAIRLYGPRLRTQREEALVIARALGKEIKITTVSEEEFISFFVKLIPEPIARLLVSDFKMRAGLVDDDGFYAESEFKKASINIEKYSGRRPTEFEEWAEDNKGLFV
ncbi:related to NmrA-like family protein [Cephalotrichum gorgonifer]|uniref:Related to NmrA-like family protein n=1 Tax=Cephalotrichum gorgonifer TaxID=2041049 RepID=A0AAE8N6L3_9PEZI|nr:related to NmrA-like family protein [Cephalotrichum gorgonifer]